MSPNVRNWENPECCEGEVDEGDQDDADGVRTGSGNSLPVPEVAAGARDPAGCQ